MESELGKSPGLELSNELLENLRAESFKLEQCLVAEVARQVDAHLQSSLAAFAKCLGPGASDARWHSMEAPKNLDGDMQDASPNGFEYQPKEPATDKAGQEDESPRSKPESNGQIAVSEGELEIGTTPDSKAPRESHNSDSSCRQAKLRKQKSISLQKKLGAQEEESLSFLMRIVTSRAFEGVSGGVIVANTIVMAVRRQYDGIQTGYELKMEGFNHPAAAEWPGAEGAFTILNAVFNSCFILELLIRLVAMRLSAVKSGWIWFDTIIVTLGTLDWIGVGNIGLQPSVMRLLRLVRLLRMLKILQKLAVFESLFVLIRSIRASFGALVWSFALLLTMQMMFALLFCQLLSEFLVNDDNDGLVRAKVFEYFGTFANGMLSMFEVSLANWIPICRLLYDDVSAYYGLSFVLYRCMLCFAVVKTITAVFISETNKAAAGDMEIVMMKKQKEREKMSKELKGIFYALDDSGDGEISREEFDVIVNNDYMRNWFSSQQIEVSDLELLFKIFDQGKGTIEVDEFIDGIARMKGPAKSMDVVALLKMAHTNQSKIDQLLSTVSSTAQNSNHVGVQHVTRSMTMMMQQLDVKLEQFGELPLRKGDGHNHKFTTRADKASSSNGNGLHPKLVSKPQKISTL